MKRPRGVTLLAVWFLAIGVGWGAESIRLGMIGWEYWNTFGKGMFLWGAGYIMFSTTFLAIGYGLWRLRSWARIAALGLACLSSSTFLVGFVEWVYVRRGDILTRFQAVLESALGLLLLPYGLLSWPFREWAVNLLFGDVVYTVDFYLRFLLGFVGYALVAFYLLRNTQVKQAFGANP